MDGRIRPLVRLWFTLHTHTLQRFNHTHTTRAHTHTATHHTTPHYPTPTMTHCSPPSPFACVYRTPCWRFHRGCAYAILPIPARLTNTPCRTVPRVLLLPRFPAAGLYPPTVTYTTLGSPTPHFTPHATRASPLPPFPLRRGATAAWVV